MDRTEQLRVAGQQGAEAELQTALRAALPGAAQVAVWPVEQGLSVTVKARAALPRGAGFPGAGG